MNITPIVGVWSSRADIPSEFFTTVLYPYSYTDDLAMTVPTVQEVVAYQEPQDDMLQIVPTLQSGTLVATIAYPVYNEPLAIEDLSQSVPTLQSGTLQVTISYINYDEPLAIENMSQSVPTLQSGTLT